MEGETISSESRTSFDTVTILVVDDDITCLAIVAAILKKFKYEVVTVKHPSDALCTLRVKGGAFDLVVSDIHMPDMNGFELQQAISQEFHLPVVLMSADKKEGVISKGLENGAAFFISKPVSPDDLRNLWQFAATKKRSSQAAIKGIVGSNDLLPQGITSDDKENSNAKPVVIAASTSSNRGCRSTKNSKRKTPRKEGSDDDEERGNNDSHNAAASNKKPKVIWTNALHNRFLEAIRSIGLDRCVPKKILEVMDVPGLTRENVASHLQKYRIFLRRVSDASSLIHGVDDKGLLSRSTINRFSKFQYHHQNPGNFSGGLNKMAQPRFGQSQLCSSNVSLSEPNIVRTNMIGPNDRPGDGITQQNNYETSQLFQGNLSNDVLSACFDASNLASTWETPSIITPDDQVSVQNNGISSIPSTSFPDQTNYVGYEISNIKHLAESRSNDELQNNSFIIHNGASDLPNDDNNINLEQLMVIVNDGEQLSDVVNSTLHRHHQNLPMPPLDHHDPPNFLGNEGTINEGQIHDLSSEFSHIYHVPEFDVTSRSLLPFVEGDQVNIQNQLTQINGGENITSSSLLYGGTNNHWDNHVSSYDQAPDQRDDDDFLASLLGTFGDDQPFDGI